MLRHYFQNLEQGTDEWFQLRAGCVTASEFSTVLSKGRGSAPSKTRQTYMLKLIGEQLTGELQEYFTNAHMERGKIMEEEARLMYQMLYDVDVEACGFIKLGAQIGYSPDGIVGDAGLIEIKTKLPHLQLDVLLSDQVPSEHVAQLQGGLWVSDREWCDFISYWPKLPTFIKRVYRDEAYIKELEAGVTKFLEDMDELIEKIRSL